MLERFKTIEFRTDFFFALFVASVIMSNMIGGKVSEIQLFGIPVVFSVGLLPFFLTFFILDSVNEVHGKQKAREMIWATMLVLVFVSAITIAAVAMPYAERSWVKPEQFGAVFGSSIRIIFASLMAFILADLMDARVFNFLHEKTGGKMLWLRSNISNFISQTIDTCVFMFLAFWDFFGLLALPNSHDAGFVIALIVPYLTLKLILSVINTPFVYAGVRFLRGADSANGKA